MPHLDPSLLLLPMLPHYPRRQPLNPTLATLTCWPLLWQESDPRSYDLISVCCLQKKMGNTACPKHAHVLWVSLAKSGGRPLLPSSPATMHQQHKSTSMMTGPRTLVATFPGATLREQNLLSPSIRRRRLQTSLACTIHPRNLRAFLVCRGASMPQYAPLNPCHPSLYSHNLGPFQRNPIPRQQLQVSLIPISESSFRVVYCPTQVSHLLWMRTRVAKRTLLHLKYSRPSFN